MSNTTTTTTVPTVVLKEWKPKNTKFYHQLYSLPTPQLQKKLLNRVVTYHNEMPSSVKNDAIRHLVIKKIEKISFSKDYNRRYVQAEVIDLDDGGKTKFRTLHVAGISKIKGRLSTAWTLAKSVF